MSPESDAFKTASDALGRAISTTKEAAGMISLWCRIEALLRASIASLPKMPLEALEFLEHNEFKLAYDVVNEAASGQSPGPAFFVCMTQAAKLMKLPPWDKDPLPEWAKGK